MAGPGCLALLGAQGRKVRRYLRPDGYVWLDVDGVRIAEHRVVAALTLGRSLKPSEIVHHLNGVRDDNRPENLEVLSGRAEHQSLHMDARKEERKAQVSEAAIRRHLLARYGSLTEGLQSPNEKL